MVALVIGLVLIVAGILMDAPSAHEWLIRRITSRSLGTLAPGYAASDRGLMTYTGLVRVFGLIVVSLWVASLSAQFGGLLLILGVGGFVWLSARAIAGEVRTYRALKR